MNTAVALAALAAAAAAHLLTGPGRRAPGPGDGPEAPHVVDETALLLRLRPVICGCAGAGGWVLLGDAAGLLAGGLLGWICWRVLGSAESPGAARRREQLARDLPTGVDLIAACVQAGAAVESALVTVADAIGGPLAEELRGVHHRLALGIDPVTAWRQLDAEELAPLVRAVLRAHDSGAAVSEAVLRLADDLREQARSDVLARASSVEVRAAAPLGACFLPAFLLLAVVPLVAGTFAGLRPF